MSPVTRGMPCAETFTPRTMLPPPTDTDADAECLRGHRIGGDPARGGLVDAEAVRAHQGLAGDLHHDASVDRLGHGALSDRRPVVRNGPDATRRIRRCRAWNYSESCFSTPSPTA